MKLNWKVRFKNKTLLVTFITVIVSVVYLVLAALEIVPKISQDTVMNCLLAIVTILTGLGIVTDPTTKGITDSERALEYEELGGEEKWI